jgi:hypothetical protein
MSPLLTAVLALAALPTEAVRPGASAVFVRESRVGLRTGADLRDAVRDALPRWARPTDTRADEAARVFLRLHEELRADTELSRSQRKYFLTKVRIRLNQLSDQITKRIAREKRLAKGRKPKSVQLPDDKGPALAQQQGRPGGGLAPRLGMGGAGFGGRPGQVPDHGQELVDLIQTVIRPESWDVNGGPGTIYYWYPGRALVIRQMGDVHGQVGGALDQLRRAGR